MKFTVLVAAGTALLASCSSAPAKDRIIDTQTGQVRVEIFAERLDHPWGAVFLPDGRMLVTERPGNLRLVSREGGVSEPLKGVPAVFAEGQGGLLDIIVDPEFTANRTVYFSYAEPGEGGAGTAVARARLGDGGLEDAQVIFRQQPKVSGGHHFGSRLVISRDRKLFITTGDRNKFDPAQDLGSHIGKVLRINLDGSVPSDNPFVGRAGARPEIWSYGHRNAQGAALHPQTGALWENEYGPRGGDELNIPERGVNYGWPLVSWGRHYSGQDIPKPPTRPDLAQPIYYWNPVISPSGMDFYTGDLFPGWRGNLLIAGLSSEGIVRLTLDGDRVAGEERISLRARIRDVQQGPDGAVYALTDQTRGEILRLTPASAR